MTQAKIEGKFYPLQHQEWLRACRELTPAELKVLYYIRTADPYSNGVRLTAAAIAALEPKAIAKELGVNRSTVSRTLKELVEKGFLPEEAVKQYISPEKQVRDRLFDELGGLTEVKNPAGRIDLLTNSEIIEVKKISEWKAGLGQILVYSGFYPEHQKRLHLFGNAKEEKQIFDIAASCLAFNVLVTFEVLEVEE